MASRDDEHIDLRASLCDAGNQCHKKQKNESASFHGEDWTRKSPDHFNERSFARIHGAPTSAGVKGRLVTGPSASWSHPTSRAFCRCCPSISVVMDEKSPAAAPRKGLFA